MSTFHITQADYNVGGSIRHGTAAVYNLDTLPVARVVGKAVVVTLPNGATETVAALNSELEAIDYINGMYGVGAQ